MEALKSSQGLKKEEQSWRFPLVTAIASVLGAVITVGLLALFAFPDKS
jgi:membrane protein YqaA with SNARE-associated domain